MVTALFAMAFLAAGYYFGLRSVASMLWKAHHIPTHWQPTPAELLNVKFVAHPRAPGGRGSTTYSVQASYRYTVSGQTYEGNRVGLDHPGVSDGFYDWHRQREARLNAVRTKGDRITAWINPAQPNESLIDPSIPWPTVFGRLPIALTLTSVGLLTALLAVAIARGQATVEKSSPTRTIDARQRPSEGTGTESSTTVLLIITPLWCSMAWPLTGLVWTDTSFGALAKTIATLCSLVSVMLTVVLTIDGIRALRRAFARKRRLES